MYKKFVFLVSAVLVLALVGNASAGQVGYWNFDDDTANDSSGTGNHGTFVGDANTIVDGNIPGLGAGNRVLNLDGVDDYVNIGEPLSWPSTGPVSAAMWIKVTDVNGFDVMYETWFEKGSIFRNYRNGGGWGYRVYTTNLADKYLNYRPYYKPDWPYIYVDSGDWHHLGFVWDQAAGMRYIYFNGYEVQTEAATGEIGSNTYDLLIGASSDFGARDFGPGQLDEVYLFDSVVSEASMRALASNNQAYNPNPDDGFEGQGEIDVAKTLASLSWSAVGAVDCRVYLGTSFADVNNGVAGVDKGVVAGLSYSGAPMGALTLGETYYWRIDVNDGNEVTPGFVWDFTVVQGVSSNPDPWDGRKYVSTSKQLSWIAGDSAIKSEVFLSDNQQWVIDACDSIRTTINVPDPCVLSPALAADTSYYWRVDSNTGTLYFPGSVWTFSTDTTSPEPNLIGYWPLDEKWGASSLTWDISGKGHHGTFVQGQEPNTTIGIVSDPERGNVLELDNPVGNTISSTVYCGGGNTGIGEDPCWAVLTDQVTIMGWTKVDTFHHTYQIMLSHAFAYALTRGGVANTARFYTWDLTDKAQVGTTSLLDGQWHHVAGTYDNGVNERHIYVDGNLESTEYPDGSLRSVAAGFQIGGFQDGSYLVRGWDGLIDDVKLYDVALPGWKIRAITAVCATCVGDLDANSVVNLDDLNQLIGDLTLAKIACGQWLIIKGDPQTGTYWKNCSDMDTDGDIDLKDLNRMVGNLTWEKLFWGNWYYSCGKYNP